MSEPETLVGNDNENTFSNHILEGAVEYMFACQREGIPADRVITGMLACLVYAVVNCAVGVAEVEREDLLDLVGFSYDKVNTVAG